MRKNLSPYHRTVQIETKSYALHVCHLTLTVRRSPRIEVLSCSNAAWIYLPGAAARSDFDRDFGYALAFQLPAPGMSVAYYEECGFADVVEGQC